MNVYDIVIVLLLAVLLAGAVYSLVKNRGISCCSSDCSNCSRNCNK